MSGVKPFLSSERMRTPPRTCQSRKVRFAPSFPTLNEPCHQCPRLYRVLPESERPNAAGRPKVQFAGCQKTVKTSVSFAKGLWPDISQ